MRAARAVTFALLPVLALACSRAEKLPPPQRPKPVPSMFNPSSMRLHPTFTQIKNWSGRPDGQPDGIEAELEFSDSFGDPVKAEGSVSFEIYEYRTDSADVKGRRITTPFVGSLLTAEEQRARWNPVTRTYTFRLAYPRLTTSRAYVLHATFEPKAGGRFFSRIILQPQGGAK